MSQDVVEVDSSREAVVDAGPFGSLPRIDGRRARLEGRLSRLGDALPDAIAWLCGPIGLTPDWGRPEVADRAAGLGRPGVIAQLVWPRLGTRVGLGIETSLSHAIVDRLLGFERFPGEERLQVTPVEWGILTFALAGTLDRLADRSGPLGPWDLTLDRVGPDPFDPRDLGDILTVRWPLRVGDVSGSVRLWLPESVVSLWLAAPSTGGRAEIAPRPDLSSGPWKAEFGAAPLARGLARLRVGGVLPIAGPTSGGTVQSPAGPVQLTLRGEGVRYVFDAEPAPRSGGGRLVLKSLMRLESSPREPLPVTPSADAPSPTASPADVPVTLTVELGRLHLPLSRLADLKPGDLLELGRHAREPVELTSGGRLVARGELVQIDTELGVRITNVFL